MLNPEAPRLLGAYRLLVPEQARKAVAARVSADARQQMKKRLAGASAATRRVRAARAGRKLGALLDADRQVVVIRGSARIAHTVGDLTALRARRHNLDQVLGVLAAAGIDHFAVRNESDTVSVVGVPASRRDDLKAAFIEACADSPAYVAAAGAKADRLNALAHLKQSWHRLEQTPAIRITWYQTDPTGLLTFDAAFGCDIEFWKEEDGQLLAPRRNAVSETVSAVGETVRVSESYFTDMAPQWRQDCRTAPTRPEFNVRTGNSPDFPVDVVYTWVNGTDPEWARRRAEFSEEVYHAQSANAARYVSRDELRYSLRSLHAYAPWIRDIYLVTDGQVPEWLNTEQPGLRVVTHKEIFAFPDALPTFNSHAIESQLHHIDGLSEHFLYFNDDMLIGMPVVPQDFFTANGLTKFFPSPGLVPLGEISPDDTPVIAAGKNNRRLIQERFGSVPVQKMRHVPYSLRRSILEEIEAAYPRENEQTARSRFRSTGDHSFLSSFYHYYAFHQGKAIPSELQYRYCDLAEPTAERTLGMLLARRNHHAFCVNDTTSSSEVDVAERHDRLTPFLNAYFPVPSPFERQDPERPDAVIPPV